MSNPLAEDLDHILLHTRELWEELRGGRLFVTGGTGFYGCWLLESFVWACEHLDLDAEAVVLTRRPEAFAGMAPHLANHRCLEFMRGDVLDFSFPVGRFTHVIHAATETSVSLNVQAPLSMFDTIVQGTRRVLEFAAQAGVRQFLLTSSGAVYGRPQAGMANIPEDYAGGPDPTSPSSAYAEGKRAAEMMCCLFAQGQRLECKIARGFACVGPFLPWNRQYAAGNFVRDGWAGNPIRVNGDGTPCRSYLYAADLAIWLWTILLRGSPCRPYNVGSDRPVTIAELAGEVAACFRPRPQVLIAREAESGLSGDRYVPAVDRARQELGLEAWTPLPKALRKTVEYLARTSRPERQEWMVHVGPGQSPDRPNVPTAGAELVDQPVLDGRQGPE